MDETEYLASRVDDQINWYDGKSMTFQKRLKQFRLIEVVAAAFVPFVAGFTVEPFPTDSVVGLLGVLIVIVSALISMNKYEEKWTEYRTTCETLKHEKMLYVTRSGPYQSADSFNVFVESIERMISKENSKWSTYVKDNNKE